MRISDWSSDVCSSDLLNSGLPRPDTQRVITQGRVIGIENECRAIIRMPDQVGMVHKRVRFPAIAPLVHEMHDKRMTTSTTYIQIGTASCRARVCQYVKISVVAVLLNKNKNPKYRN